MKRFLYGLYISLIIFSSCQTQQEENLNLKHVNHIANSINNDLHSIENTLTNTANTLQYKVFFDKEVKDFSDDIYQYASNGILLSKYSKSRSAIYYPSGKTSLHHLKKTIINSEILDSVFFNSIKDNLLLSQMYFLDTNSFLRIYPYIDITHYLKPNIDLREFAPYQTIKNKPLINDQAYWLKDPFADPYGRGWIISCVEPVYYRDDFIGIISGDITLRSLMTKYFSSGTELLLLIDQRAKVICCTKEAGKITNVPYLREFGYYKPITKDIYVYNNPNLTEHKNKSLNKAIKSLLSGKTIESFSIDNKKYTIYKSIVEETDWCLLKIIN